MTRSTKKSNLYVLSTTVVILIVLAVLRAEVAAENDHVPLKKLSAKAGPTLKFFYCYSCGYRKVFEQYVNILQKRYPALQIEGEHFNPPGYNMMLATMLGVAKILAIILIVTGINIFQWIGQPQPSLWQWCLDNRFYACIIIFFVCNAIEGQLIASGAFEIHFNDIPVWSKLETGKIPQPLDLFQIIERHLEMQFIDSDVEHITFDK